MPAIMPPINPNIIAALGQYFGGMQNRTIRTPPFVKPGGMVNRGEVLGRPSMPTPGMPQPMPSGGAAPTAPGVAPPPRSLGDALSTIPIQPTLTPTPRAATPVAAAPATPPPNYQLDPGELPEGFSEIKDASDGSRRLVDADGNEYVYNASGRQISGPPPPAAAAAAAAPPAAPYAEPPEEDTSRTATQRGIKSTVANELGGRTDEDTDGTKYVYDKNNKLVKTIAPPGGSPVTGTQPGGGAQAPASMPQQKRGVWSTLTDPSLAGIALAAGQQMTRARYPGESGIGNAVNAVTAGYNTLAQQRQMQYAREQAAREQQMKQAKQDQDIAESKSRAEQNRAQAERYGKQTEHEATADKLAQVKFDQEKLDKKWQQQHDYYKLAIDEKRDLDAARHQREMEKLDRERVDLQRETNQLARIKFGQDVYEFGIKRIDDKEFNKRRLEYEGIRSRAAATQAQAAVTRAGAEHLTPHVNTATRVVLSEIKAARDTAINNGDPFTEPDDDAVTDRIMQMAGKMANKPAAAAPAPRILGPVSDPKQEVEGRTGSYNGVPGIVRNGQWVAR